MLNTAGPAQVEQLANMDVSVEKSAEECVAMKNSEPVEETKPQAEAAPAEGDGPPEKKRRKLPATFLRSEDGVQERTGQHGAVETAGSAAASDGALEGLSSNNHSEEVNKPMHSSISAKSAPVVAAVDQGQCEGDAHVSAIVDAAAPSVPPSGPVVAADNQREPEGHALVPANMDTAAFGDPPSGPVVAADNQGEPQGDALVPANTDSAAAFGQGDASENVDVTKSFLKMYQPKIQVGEQPKETQKDVFMQADLIVPGIALKKFKMALVDSPNRSTCYVAALGVEEMTQYKVQRPKLCGMCMGDHQSTPDSFWQATQRHLRDKPLAALIVFEDFQGQMQDVPCCN